jgi:hypothetical protein
VVTKVGASPEALRVLAASLTSGAAGLADRARRLGALSEALGAHRPDLVASMSSGVVALARVAADASRLGGRVESLASAFELADRLGLADSVEGPWSSPTNQVRADRATVDRLLGFDPAEVFDPLVGRLEARVADLEQSPPPANRVGRAQEAAWRSEIADLRLRISQYRALADPPFEAWGGVGNEVWLDHRSFLTDVTRATGSALALAPAVSPSATRGRAAIARDRVVERAFRVERPFLSGALAAGVIITPGRLAVLHDLDALMARPLHEFESERRDAAERRPHYDWTSDGCSGPIPAEATGACLRHDFAYRNARMLRDQWGLDQRFAEHVKATADDVFAAELWSTYEWHERDPLLTGWIWAADAAVSRWGSVESPWRPPPPGRFWGSEVPG